MAAVQPFDPGGPVRADLSALVADGLGDRHQVRLGAWIDVLSLPGVVALERDTAVGFASYAVRGGSCELAAMVVHDAWRRRGVGRLLLDAVVVAARAAGGGDVWLVTTNDNLAALGLYQRAGFRIVELHAGGVDRARRLKPLIPLEGDGGIERHDELVLRRLLAPG